MFASPDHEVAETVFTAFSSTAHPVSARLIVRRFKRRPLPRCIVPGVAISPVFTNSTLPTTTVDVVHRPPAIIETVFSDLIDGPLVHTPSGSFGANSSWVQCAAIAHNLLRARTRIAPATTLTVARRMGFGYDATSLESAHPHPA